MNERELVAGVESRLREDFPCGAYLPEDRLRSEIVRAERENDPYLTIKIPSHSEFELTLAEGRAYLNRYLRG